MVVGMDGQPQGPLPHVHILPCPYYTRAWRGDSSYRRGERGEDVVGGPLWSPVRCPVHILPRPYNTRAWRVDTRVVWYWLTVPQTGFPLRGPC